MKSWPLVIGGSLLLLGAAVPPNISVGPTAHISAVRSRLEHVEAVAGGDPNSQRLIACSMLSTRPLDAIQTVTYVSDDAGTSWRPGVIAPRGSWDPDCHATADGGLYFATMSGQNTEAPPKIAEKSTYVLLWTSHDGGAHWSGPSRYGKAHAQDRLWFAVDDYSTSKYRGRLYLTYFSGTGEYHRGKPLRFTQELVTTDNGGRTFSTPLRFTLTGGDEFLGPAVVTPKGTLVLFTELVTKQNPWSVAPNRSMHEPDTTLYAMVSHDGGRSLSKPIKIASIRAAQENNDRVVPTITVDRGSKQFKGRVYVGFQNSISGRSVVESAYSSDDGASWTAPHPVNDDFWATDNNNGPDDFMGTMAVNRQGVVGMMWYDRRSNADDVGYHVRFSASLDGAETWLPSVEIPGARNTFESTEDAVIWPDITNAGSNSDIARITLSDGTWYIGGHTAGMATTADGVFHPVWVDNHTGVQQLWTAPIGVRGAVLAQGDALLGGLHDITKQVKIKISHATYDRSTQTIAVSVQVTNMSKKTLRLPMYLRALNWQSDTGIAQAVNATNEGNGPGALWQLDGASNVLGSHHSTNLSLMKFRLSQLQSMHRNGQYFNNFLSITSRVFGDFAK